MRVELLCLDVDGTLTDGSLIYGLSSGNSSLGVSNSVLGMQFRTCENFQASTDSSLVDSPKISTNTKATPQSLPLRFCESQNLVKNKSARSANPYKSFCYFWLSPKVESPLPLNPNLPNNADSAPKAKFALESLEVLKIFNAKDGLALAYWTKSLNRKVAIITGKKSEILRHRARELGINLLFMGVSDKGAVVRDLKKDLGLDSTQIACVGDDLNDISMFRECALKFAPRDCASHLKTLPNIEILRCKGGRGAVREAIEAILQKEGIYEDFISVFAR